MPQRAKRNATLSYAVSSVSVVAFIGLFLIFQHQTTSQLSTSRFELKQAVEKLDAQIAANHQLLTSACAQTNTARAQSNAQVRRPLKQMLDYFSTLIAQSEKTTRAAHKKVTKLTIQAQKRFAEFSAQVTYLPQLECPGG